MKLNIVEVIAFDDVAIFNMAMQVFKKMCIFILFFIDSFFVIIVQRQIESYFESNIVKAAPLANRNALREWIRKRIALMKSRTQCDIF